MKNKLNQWRALFPSTQHGVYVNHAACSPVSTRVKSAIDELLTISSTTHIDNFPVWMETRESLRGILAQMLNTRPAHIGFVKNTSAGLNILADGLSWQRGDHILIAEGEFPSNVYPFFKLQDRGVRVEFVPTPTGRFTTDDFVSRFTAATRLVSVSFVQYHNGFRADLEALGKACRDRGILFCVDGIQGVGAVPLDVTKTYVDFLSNGGHKWLMAPGGLGFVYVGEQLIDRLTVQQVGWLSVKHPWNLREYAMDFPEDARRFELATENMLGIYGMKASVSLLMEVGIENIFYHITELIDLLAQGLNEQGWIIRSDLTPIHRSGIISFQSRDEQRIPTKNVFEKLMQSGVTVSYRDGAIRVSPHFYNTENEIRQILEKLSAGV